ncbi:adenosine deaminase [Serratia marcescens]|uniref:adenosine deaminase n=1 Tax=Serratia marcescens TaxID=615 RepID=UPI001EEE3F51|nr:adenosine deaminase [Serratia marcescens]
MELHVHLDTCLSYHYLKKIDPQITRTAFNRQFVAPKTCADLGDFLSKIAPQIALLQTQQAIALAVDDLFAQLAADNVIYAELRFAPLLHTRMGLTGEAVVETVIAAMHDASRTYGIGAGLILCTLRHFDAAASLQTAGLVVNFLGRGVVALDLAADEARYPLTNHVAAFRAVREAGGNVIAHAGEAKGADSVRETLDQLRVSRIGHGVRSIEDAALVERLIATGVLLEICPSCNLTCNLFDSIDDHPIDRLKKLGVRLNVNTDARTVADTTLNKEYWLLHDAFGWNDEDFNRCNRQALEASFLDGDTKIKLMNKLNAGPRRPGTFQD